MYRIINALIYAAIFGALIWSWETADQDLKKYLFYTVVIVSFSMIAYLGFKVDVLKEKLNTKVES